MLDSSISHCHIANTFLIKSFTEKSWNCSSSQRSNSRSYWFNGWIDVVDKLNSWISIFLSIKSDSNIVEGSWWFRESLRRRKRGRITLDYVLLHNCGIHENCSIEYAFNFIESHINKVFTFYCNLGISSDWATSRSDIVYLRGLVVKIFHCLRRVSFSFIRNC